jgi:hypothetical protein
MAGKLVTVMTFNQHFEAQLAKNYLENEGIPSTVAGELTTETLFGRAVGADQILLQVHEEDAQRATGLLAAVAAAKLEDNWEDEAESDNVWICSICGEPVSNLLSVCYSCQTPREGIRVSPSHDRTAVQPETADRKPGEEIKKPDDKFQH